MPIKRPRQISLHFASTMFNPTDSTTYYLSPWGATIQAVELMGQDISPVSGRIRKATVVWKKGEVLGTAEDISFYVRTGGVDTLIETIGNTDDPKYFFNKNLNIAIAEEAPISIKLVTPAWVTNPTVVYCSANIIIDTA